MGKDAVGKVTLKSQPRQWQDALQSVRSRISTLLVSFRLDWRLIGRGIGPPSIIGSAVGSESGGTTMMGTGPSNVITFFKGECL